MRYPALSANSYQGSLLSFLRTHVRPAHFPKAETLRQLHSEILSWVALGDGLVIRKYGSTAARGCPLSSQDGTSYWMADNEPALWTFMEAWADNLAAQEWAAAMSGQLIPIAFARTKKEAKTLQWRTVGRKHLDFSAGGWKHCHLLRCVPESIKTIDRSEIQRRSLRLLHPMNHFPFPSPRKYLMPKDWGEDVQCLRVIATYLKKEVYTPLGVADLFAEFWQKAGGSLDDCSAEGEDIPIDLCRRQTAIAPIEAKPEKEYDFEISTDESWGAIPSKTLASSLDEMWSMLRNWYDHTSEDTIGNVGTFGRKAWIIVAESEVGRMVLNADTTRAGVAAALEALERHRVLCPMVIKGAKGSATKVVFAEEPQPITGFYLYI